jgi:hypothetical protein
MHTHCDAGTAKLMAHRGHSDAQLGTDLPQGPTLTVQVGRTLNVHRATVASLSQIGCPPNRDGCREQVWNPSILERLFAKLSRDMSCG